MFCAVFFKFSHHIFISHSHFNPSLSISIVVIVVDVEFVIKFNKNCFWAEKTISWNCYVIFMLEYERKTFHHERHQWAKRSWTNFKSSASHWKVIHIKNTQKFRSLALILLFLKSSKISLLSQNSNSITEIWNSFRKQFNYVWGWWNLRNESRLSRAVKSKRLTRRMEEFSLVRKWRKLNWDAKKLN